MRNRPPPAWDVAEPDAPVWVVGGFLRSGTTMMMQALERGGMTVARAPAGHELHPYYELAPEGCRNVYSEHPDTGAPIRDEDRYPGQYRGQLIKALVGSVRWMFPQPGRIQCVWMHRDEAAIRRSYARLNPLGHPPAQEQMRQAIREDLSRWRQRPDVDLVELPYDAVCAHPETAFTILKRNGWPIDVQAAMQIVRVPA